MFFTVAPTLCGIGDNVIALLILHEVGTKAGLQYLHTPQLNCHTTLDCDAFLGLGLGEEPAGTRLSRGPFVRLGCGWSRWTEEVARLARNLEEAGRRETLLILTKGETYYDRLGDPTQPSGARYFDFNPENFPFDLRAKYQRARMQDPVASDFQDASKIKVAVHIRRNDALMVRLKENETRLRRVVPVGDISAFLLKTPPTSAFVAAVKNLMFLAGEKALEVRAFSDGYQKESLESLKKWVPPEYDLDFHSLKALGIPIRIGTGPEDTKKTIHSMLDADVVITTGTSYFTLMLQAIKKSPDYLVINLFGKEHRRFLDLAERKRTC
jgi:hypothetical protein